MLLLTTAAKQVLLPSPSPPLMTAATRPLRLRRSRLRTRLSQTSLSFPLITRQNAAMSIPLVMPTATDNCSMVTITEDPDTTYMALVLASMSSPAPSRQPMIVAMKSLQSRAITIEDNTAPVFDPYMKTVVVERTDGDADDINYFAHHGHWDNGNAM